MRQWIVLGCLCLAACSTEADRKTQRFKALNQEIEQVKTEINSEEKKALNAEVEGEGFMRGDYAQFAEVLEKSEQSEERAHKLNEQLKKLEEEKKQLESQ
ncbi:MAG: hypothetical protein ACK5MA_09095 [Parachlamydiaceae bacterium]